MEIELYLIKLESGNKENRFTWDYITKSEKLYLEKKIRAQV